MGERGRKKNQDVEEIMSNTRGREQGVINLGRDMGGELARNGKKMLKQ